MLADERIDYLAYSTRDFDFNRFARAIEAEVRAEVCSAQNSEYAPQDCLSLTDATQVRMEAQEPVASANDAAKMRFFRDMTSPERRKVFEVFGIESAVLNEVRSLSDETRLFKHLFAARQPPAPCPKCAEAERIEALATAKLGDEIIKNGSLQDKLAQLECDFALEHDDKLELQAKVAEQRAEIERLQSKLDLLVIERDAQAVLISDQQADVEKQTEISNNFAAQVRQQNETITSLRAEVDHRQLLLRESNRNCAEHAGIIWERNVTIQQQAALIEKCEILVKDVAAQEKRDKWCGPATELLAAIAAQKGGAK